MTETMSPEAISGSDMEAAIPPASAKTGTDESGSSTDGVQTPDFSELKAEKNGKGEKADLKRLMDVRVTVSAELGRVSLPIQELLQLSEGSVLELNRNVESPVELIAQGVPFGRGEVVVVDDNFAIRIQEIYPRP